MTLTGNPVGAITGTPAAKLRKFGIVVLRHPIRGRRGRRR